MPDGTAPELRKLDARRLAMRKAAFGVWALVAVVGAFAILLNVLLTPAEDRGFLARAEAAEEASRPGSDFTPEKAAVTLLPETVIAYETMARHEVPGKGKLAAEALYVTLNMDTEIQVPIVSYARVDAHETEAEAREEILARYAQYPKKREDILIKGGSTVAMTGFREDEGAYFVGWTKGSYSVWVKTSFRDKVPYTKRNFLHNVAQPVIEAIDKFQRTGREGLKL